MGSGLQQGHEEEGEREGGTISEPQQPGDIGGFPNRTVDPPAPSVTHQSRQQGQHHQHCRQRQRRRARQQQAARALQKGEGQGQGGG